LRHSFVAILVAAERPEVSEWAGHNSVAFTLTRYGGLFENGSEAAVDRLDLLLEAPRRCQATCFTWTLGS
jgi:integrase